MEYVIEVEQEIDGRWLGFVSAMPGVMAYGDTPEQAREATRELADKVSVHARIREALKENGPMSMSDLAARLELEERATLGALFDLKIRGDVWQGIGTWHLTRRT
jgi:predicted RNase H-like HicB family nuclease